MKNKYPLLFACILLLNLAGCKKEDASPADAPQEKIAFKLKLKNTNGDITYNQSFSILNSLEYKWAILADSDNDSTTGDFDGYDVEISMSYYKQSNSSITGSLLSKTQQNTWILSKNTGTWGHTLSAYIDSADNTLVLTGVKAFAELSAINAGDKIKIKTWSAAGHDESMTGIFPQKTNVPMDDATPDYIDIISLEIVE